MRRRPYKVDQDGREALGASRPSPWQRGQGGKRQEVRQEGLAGPAGNSPELGEVAQRVGSVVDSLLYGTRRRDRCSVRRTVLPTLARRFSPPPVAHAPRRRLAR